MTDIEALREKIETLIQRHVWAVDHPYGALELHPDGVRAAADAILAAIPAQPAPVEPHKPTYDEALALGSEGSVYAYPEAHEAALRRAFEAGAAFSITGKLPDPPLPPVEPEGITEERAVKDSLTVGVVTDAVAHAVGLAAIENVGSCVRPDYVKAGRAAIARFKGAR